MDKISIDDFKKLDIRIGKIKSAERISGADKLLKLIFDIGARLDDPNGRAEDCQILSGIAETYPDPSVLVGKLVPVLLNLEPRKMKGEISNGMMLAIDFDGKTILLSPSEEIPPGSIVK